MASQPLPSLDSSFEQLNFKYNSFQAGLAFLQKLFPAHAGRIVQVQRWMMITDTIALLRDSVNLYGHYKNDARDQNQSPLLKVVKTAFAISLAYGVFAIGIHKKPSFDMKSLINPDLLKNVNVFWSTPGLHKLSRCILGVRVAINFASAFLSSKDERNHHLTAVTLQAFTLYNISQLPWLKFERTFHKPNGSIWASSGHQDALRSLTLQSHFLPLDHLNKTNFPSAFQSIYEYCNNYFNGSKGWWGFWMIKRSNGIETSRWLTFDVEVLPTPMRGPLRSYIDHVSAWAIDKVDGFASVEFMRAI
jgi:hypothetical protein